MRHLPGQRPCPMQVAPHPELTCTLTGVRRWPSEVYRAGPRPAGSTQAISGLGRKARPSGQSARALARASVLALVQLRREWSITMYQHTCSGIQTAPGRRQLGTCIHSVARELCALARVDMCGSREPSRSSEDDFPVPGLPAHRRLRVRISGLPGAACVDRRRSASRLGIESTRPLLGIFSPRPWDCAACCRGDRVPAFQRSSLWLDQASATRALAVAPRGSSGASTTAAMSSRCSPEPSVRSRLLPGAVA
jgi:hypothetical protein